MHLLDSTLGSETRRSLLHPMALRPVSVMGWGSYLPPDCVTNAQLEAQVATTHAWIVTRTGISARHRATTEQATSDLACHAAIQALSEAGVDAGDLDLILVGTATPDTLVPSTACWLQRQLGAPRAAAMDLPIHSNEVIDLRSKQMLKRLRQPLFTVAALTAAIALSSAIGAPPVVVDGPDHRTITHEFNVVARVAGGRCSGVAFEDPEAVKQLEFRPGDVVRISRKGKGPIKVEDWTQDWKWGGSGGFFGIGAKKGTMHTAKDGLDLRWGNQLSVALTTGAGRIVFPGAPDAQGQVTDRIDAGSQPLQLIVKGLPHTLPANLPRPGGAPRKAKPGAVVAVPSVANQEKLDTIVLTIERPVSAHK